MRNPATSSLVALAALLASSCVFVVHESDSSDVDWDFPEVTAEHRGNGTSAREERAATAAFTRIEAGAAIQVEVQVGAQTSLAVRGDSNLLEHVITKSEDGTLRLAMRSGSYETKTPIVVEVGTPELSALVLDGVARARVEGVDADSFAITLSGSSHAKLAGRASSVTARVSGSSELQAFGVDAARVDADVAGSSRAEVAAREELVADVSGSGRLTYRGDPLRMRTQASGSGRVVGP